jgi:hypothetical protein
MEEGVVEVVSIGLFIVVEEVVLGWHVVALTPVGLPLSEDWESGLDLEFDAILVSEGVR